MPQIGEKLTQLGQSMVSQTGLKKVFQAEIKGISHEGKRSTIVREERRKPGGESGGM